MNLGLIILSNDFTYSTEEKKSDLMHKFTTSCRTLIVIFTFVTPLMVLKRGANGVGKTLNQLTYIHMPSSGKILN